MINVLICDDQSLFREALRTLLSSYVDINVIAEAASGEEAIRLGFMKNPDVILMDMRMPGIGGVEATRRIAQSGSKTKVLVLTTFDDDETVFDGIRAGAVGYLLKDVSSEKLIEAIRAAAKGEYFLQPSITAKVVSEFSRISKPSSIGKDTVNPLSPRENEILSLVATGASNREIAEKLFISEGTVKNHLSNILSKLGVRDRMQAILKAKDLGIINI